MRRPTTFFSLYALSAMRQIRWCIIIGCRLIILEVISGLRFRFRPIIVRSIFSKSIWHRTLKLDVIYHLIQLNNPSEFGLCSSNRTEIISGMRLDASFGHIFFPLMHTWQWDKFDDVIIGCRLISLGVMPRTKVFP